MKTKNDDLIEMMNMKAMGGTELQMRMVYDKLLANFLKKYK